MRYQKVEGQKVDANARFCSICQTKSIGDEWHYLTGCQNEVITNIREEFVEKVKRSHPQLREFEIIPLMTYCISMQDISMQHVCADFASKILEAYTDESEEKTAGTCSLM